MLSFVFPIDSYLHNGLYKDSFFRLFLFLLKSEPFQCSVQSLDIFILFGKYILFL